MLKIKKSVVFKMFRIEMITILQVLDELSNRSSSFDYHINQKDIWITSANDGKHRKNSYHYKNLALDICIKNLTKKDIDLVLLNLKGVKFNLFKFDVVLEKDYIHIEYDEGRA